MNKTIRLLTLILCCIICGCGENNDVETDSDIVKNPSEKEKPVIKSEFEKIDDLNFYYRDIKYTIDSDGLHVSGWKKNGDYIKSGIIIIPSDIEYDGRIRQVKAVDSKAFHHSDIKKIELPVTVRSIGDYAFWVCEKLDTVILSNKIDKIGKEAFGYCSNLHYITLPGSLQYIPEKMFYECISLESIDIPKSIGVIREDAFRNCEKLKNVNFLMPSMLGEFESYSFSNCISLESFTLPPNLSVIGSSAFEGCLKLKEFNMNDKLASIGGKAFYDCQSLLTFTIPQTVHSLGSSFSTQLYGQVDIGEIWFNCISLKDVFSYMKYPPENRNFFWDKDAAPHITLHIPKGQLQKYNQRKWEITSYSSLKTIIDDL